MDSADSSISREPVAAVDASDEDGDQPQVQHRLAPGLRTLDGTDSGNNEVGDASIPRQDMPYALHDHQDQGPQAIRRKYDAGVLWLMACMPMGFGKTVCERQPGCGYVHLPDIA